MKPAPGDAPYQGVRLTAAAAGAIALSVVAVLLFGFWPGGALDTAVRSAATLTQTGVPVAHQ
jgi:hypothetical protein